MSLPPAALLPLLARFPEERALGSLLTAAVHEFPARLLGAHGPTAAVWALATQRRFWLVAHEPAEEQTWAVAIGRAGQVHLEEGWQRDLLRVGPWVVPLRRGARREAQELIARWTRAGPDGDPWPLHEPLPAPDVPGARGAAAAQGALHVPRIDEAERALVAIETDHAAPQVTFRGMESAPVRLWVSSHRTALVTPHPDGRPAVVRALPIGPLTIDGRHLVVDQARLLPKGTRSSAELALALAAVAEPAERWAVAARHALIHREPARALALIAEAHQVGAGEACWTHLAQLALAHDQGALAAAAASRALRARPDLDVPAVVALWEREAGALHRSLRAARISWRKVRQAAGAPLDALAAAPAPPEDLPGPPATAAEVWATALACEGRLAEARAQWPDRGDARDHRAMAVLAGAQGASDAASAWDRAAERARAEGENPYRSLALATEVEETAARRWRWGAWAWIDGRHEEARANFRRAIALDDGAGALREPMPVQAHREVAAIAERTGRPAAAERSLDQAIREDPACETTRLRHATLLADTVRRPRDAAEARLALVRDLDAGALREPSIARWEHLIAAARLLTAAGEPPRALAALHDAVEGSYLEPAALAAVLAERTVYIPIEVRAWWAHLDGVLAGRSSGEPLPGSTLDRPALDALHPGGTRWLDALRRGLESPTCPSAAVLTRGLDPASEAGHAQVDALVEQLAARIGLADPPRAFVFRGQGAHGISAWPATPPVLLIGAQHLDPTHPRHLSPAELRFAIAAELVHLRCEHPLLSFEQTWMGTSRSLYDQVDGWAGAAEAVFDLVTLLPGLDQARKVGTLVRLGRTALKVRSGVSAASRLAEPVAGWFGSDREPERRGLSRERLTTAAVRLRIQAERAALLLGGDLRAAVGATLKLSTQAAPSAELADRDGLRALLARDDAPLSASEALRLAALAGFAAAHRPLPDRVSPLVATGARP